jgi:hypothetical protein
MTDEQRAQWQEIGNFLNPPKPPDPVPLPSAANRNAMSLDVQEECFQNWVEYLNTKRDHNTWTPEERDAVRFAIKRTLKGQ